MPKAGLQRVRRLIAGEDPAISAGASATGVLGFDEASALVDSLELQVVPLGGWAEMAAATRRAHIRWREISEAWRTDTELTPDAERCLTNGHPAIGNRYQDELLQGRGFKLPSPYEDSTINAVASLPISIGQHGVWPVLYEFDSARPVIAGVSCGWGGSLDFLWLVEDNLIIHKSEDWGAWVTPQACIAHYLCICAKYRELLPSYRSADKSIALLYGFMYNLGHHFWNDVSGVEKIVRMGVEDNIDAVYARTSAWLPATYLFADFAARIRPSEDHDALCRLMFESRHMIVRSTATAMDAALAERIRAAAWRALQDQPERARAYRLEAGPPAFTLFFNLRTHNKAWLEQVDGLMAVVGELERRGHPPPRIYLDGFAECEPLVNSVRQQLGPRARIVDGTKAILAETLLWAFECDFFIAVIGSGLVLPTWIADKPGVCHGDTGHMAQLDFWPRVRPPTWPLLHPELAQIENVTQTFYANYHLEPLAVVRLVSHHLDAVGAKRPERPDAVLTRMLAHAYRFGGEAVDARGALRRRGLSMAERLDAALDERDAVKAELKRLELARDGLAAELQAATRHLAVPPGHPSSPIVDVETLEDPFRTSRDLLPLDVAPSLADHLSRWRSFGPLMDRLPCLRQDGRRLEAAFPIGDAVVLQAMIATLTPRRCIQIGSGPAFDAAAQAAEAFCTHRPAMTLVADTDALGLTESDGHGLVRGLRQAPLALFANLAADDLLCVGFSHVCKTGGDINYVLFQVLPRLPSGVHVYLQGVYWPFEYPRGFIYEQRRSWNALYAIHAFLAGNGDYEIVFFNDYFTQFAPGSARAACPDFFEDRPSGLWLKKTGAAGP